jgi:hypothetical protein
MARFTDYQAEAKALVLVRLAPPPPTASYLLLSTSDAFPAPRFSGAEFPRRNDFEEEVGKRN